MSEHPESRPERPAPYLDTLAALSDVRQLDRRMLEHSPETRQLVDIGLQFGAEVTTHYGDPLYPVWASGFYETDVFMAFHNGGRDGHTSVGEQGVGVPRNVLLLARAINAAAGSEVIGPQQRAAAFCAAEAHDRHQLCGRALMPEGQQEGRGDERLSADDAYRRCIDSGVSLAIAQEVHEDIVATAYNPATGTQNVQYDAWRNSTTPPPRNVVSQELMTCADMLSMASRRGSLGALEYTIEILCQVQQGHFLQELLRAKGIDLHAITSMEHLLTVAGAYKAFREAFAVGLNSQSRFFGQFSYSDQAIRSLCGAGVDELFPRRQQNASKLAEYSQAVDSGATPLDIWHQARGRAGY